MKEAASFYIIKSARRKVLIPPRADSPNPCAAEYCDDSVWTGYFVARAWEKHR